MTSSPTPKHSFGKFHLKTFIWFILGAFLAALGVQAFLVPNMLVDGGIVGLSMIVSHFLGADYLPYFLILFNIPFVFLAYKQIGKHFVVQMLSSVIIFAFALAGFVFIPQWFNLKPLEFHGDALEIIVLGGFIIGTGVGIIIRYGGSTDGTEILGILVNRKQGFTVGQVILVANIFIFALAGIVFKNWHSAFQSLMVYVVATKVMDIVIVGFDETKSVMIISKTPDRISKAIMHELGIGYTVMYGRGGFTGEAREILYVVVERLQLAELKELIHREDPKAFVAIENLHEVIHAMNDGEKPSKKALKEH